MTQPKSPKNVTDSGANPIKREDEGNFKVIVAIDFGTHGTGLGYAIKNDDEKKQETYIEQDWGGTRKNVDTKNKTDILLQHDGIFLKFGDEALEAYLHAGQDESSSSEEQSTSHEEEDEKENKAATKHMLFESFKMALYESNEKQDGSAGDIRDKIKCVDGREYSTQTVFIQALKFMKQKIMDTFQKKNIKISGIDDIQWILTVPAIWSDRAKYKMEYWAKKAKLINKNIFNHLRIVYEPDCASISCQYEASDQDSKSFGIGQRYCLIDAGGGTVDIAWHQVKAEYCMEEIHHPTGGPWGSDYIDDHFESLLMEIFGEDIIKTFKQENAANYTKIKDNFRKAKMSFFRNENEKFHMVDLTSELMEHVEDSSDECSKIVETCRPFGLAIGNLKMEADKLFMSQKIWRECLFDKVIDPMIKHVEEMIPIVNQIEDKNKEKKSIKYLCVAGGLASSKYFQYRIYETFGMQSAYKLSIRIPRRPILSVIDGALKLGLRPDYIKTRRLKYTYGIAVDRAETTVLKQKHRLPAGYLEEKGNVYQHPNTHKRTVRNLFSKWVSKNDPVDYGVPFEKGYRRFHKKEKTSKLSIYCSSKADPYVVEGKVLASVKIKFPDEYKGLKFIVQFYFGDTKISAKVLYKDTKSKDEEMILSDKLELVYEVEKN